MNDLLMPSDVKQGTKTPAAIDSTSPPIEPPSAKLMVQLFLVPLLIVAAAVGVMFIIGVFAGAGGSPSYEQALARLKNPGGGRTADVLVGPGAKQRYMDAKTVADKIMIGADPAERAKITDDLIDILDHHTTNDDGEVRHFLLLSLGRAWQIPPDPKNIDAAADARARALATLLKYANSDQVTNQKAAILAFAYWAGRPEL